MISIRHVVVSGKPIHVLERLLQGILVHLGPALAGEQQELEAVHAGGVHVAVLDVRGSLLVPAAVVHRAGRMGGDFINDWQDGLVTRPQIVFAERRRAVADGPRIHR